MILILQLSLCWVSRGSPRLFMSESHTWRDKDTRLRTTTIIAVDICRAPYIHSVIVLWLLTNQGRLFHCCCVAIMLRLETLDELEQWVTHIFQHIRGKWVDTYTVCILCTTLFTDNCQPTKKTCGVLMLGLLIVLSHTVHLSALHYVLVYSQKRKC